MPHKALTHDEARLKVCAVCTNQWGNKAVRRVNEKEETLIKLHILQNYSSENMYFPSGICLRCIHHLQQKDKGEEVNLKLPDNYFCHIERVLRSSPLSVCKCEWCYLARLAGPAFRTWQMKMKGKVANKVTRLCQECFMGIVEGSSHTCSVNTLNAIRNLTTTLPRHVQDKLALEILKDRQAEVAAAGEGQVVHLFPAQGGLAVPILVNSKSATPPQQPQFSHHEMMTMANSAHLTGRQINSIAADMRVKLGRNVIEPGLDRAVIGHNSMYSDFFSGERKVFWNNEGNVIEKITFWCHNVRGFLEMVATRRGKILEECNLKIGGDTGKGFLKLTASIYEPAAEAPTSKKIRRSRDDGIGGGRHFSDSGQRMILLLCVVKGVPESMENLGLLFSYVDLSGLKFTITGDFKFLMPWFGLLGCGSTHPCLYCNIERRKGVWIEKEDHQLRTLGRIESMTAAWVENGSKKTTASTSKFESCVGTVAAWGEGDMPDTTVLDKCAPPSVHCLLALNSILRPHLEKIWNGDLWEFLRQEVKVIPHSYQGKEGAFEGPQCNKILNSVEEKIKPHLLALGAHGILYLDFFIQFKKFKDSFFGTVLPADFADVAAGFKTQLNLLHTVGKVPITPKLHIMAEHVIQWVEKHGRALGEDSEQAVEASHASFDELWGSFRVNDDNSEAYLVNGKKAILKFNADHTNADKNMLIPEE